MYGKFTVPGIDEWKKNLKPDKRVQFTLTPYGPGVIIKLRGKDKIKIKRDELLKTKVYSSTLASEKLKVKLMKLSSITEEEYFRKIEIFNEKYRDVAYLTNPDEIIEMLIQFFAIKD